MLNSEIFVKTLAIFSEIYGFEYSVKYSELVYESLKDKVSNEYFEKVSNSILQQTKLEDWNSAYGYRGKPAIADWADVFIPKKQFVKKAEYYKCPITGANLVRHVMTEVGNQLKIEG